MMGNQYAKGYQHTDGHNRKIGDAHRGKELSEETKRKMGIANAKPYPAFIHRDTGEIIPAGVNLSRMCREQGLVRNYMDRVKNGKRSHHKGWALLGGDRGN